MRFCIDFIPEDRNFIGRDALEQQKDKGIDSVLKGVTLPKGSIPRAKMEVIIDENQQGIVTSGGFSPTLDCPIAIVRVPKSQLSHCTIKIRNQLCEAKLVPLPFYRRS